MQCRVWNLKLVEDDIYLVNWTGRLAWEEYVWRTNINHHAIPIFNGLEAVTQGRHPQYIKWEPHPYGCFKNGGGRNFYGSYDLEVKEVSVERYNVNVALPVSQFSDNVRSVLLRRALHAACVPFPIPNVIDQSGFPGHQSLIPWEPSPSLVDGIVSNIVGTTISSMIQIEIELKTFHAQLNALMRTYRVVLVSTVMPTTAPVPAPLPYEQSWDIYRKTIRARENQLVSIWLAKRLEESREDTSVIISDFLTPPHPPRRPPRPLAWLGVPPEATLEEVDEEVSRVSAVIASSASSGGGSSAPPSLMRCPIHVCHYGEHYTVQHPMMGDCTCHLYEEPARI